MTPRICRTVLHPIAAEAWTRIVPETRIAERSFQMPVPVRQTVALPVRIRSDVLTTIRIRTEGLHPPAIPDASVIRQLHSKTRLLPLGNLTKSVPIAIPEAVGTDGISRAAVRPIPIRQPQPFFFKAPTSYPMKTNGVYPASCNALAMPPYLRGSRRPHSRPRNHWTTDDTSVLFNPERRLNEFLTDLPATDQSVCYSGPATYAGEAAPPHLPDTEVHR